MKEVFMLLLHLLIHIATSSRRFSLGNHSDQARVRTWDPVTRPFRWYQSFWPSDHDLLSYWSLILIIPNRWDNFEIWCLLEKMSVDIRNFLTYWHINTWNNCYSVSHTLPLKLNLIPFFLKCSESFLKMKHKTERFCGDNDITFHKSSRQLSGI